MQIDEFYLLKHSELPLTNNGKVNSKKLLEISIQIRSKTLSNDTVLEWLLQQYFTFSNQEIPNKLNVTSMEDKYIVNMGANSLEIVRLVEQILVQYSLPNEESIKRRYFDNKRRCFEIIVY